MSWRDGAERILPPPRSSEPKKLRTDILDELADHLALAAERERDRENDGEDAIWKRVFDKFGDPDTLALRLWWDAMWEIVMRERIQTTAIVLAALAIVVFVGFGFKQLQAANQAVLQALQQQQGSAEVMSTIQIALHRGNPDGPPAPEVDVSVSGKWFGEDKVTIEERPQPDGTVSMGPVRQGQYTLMLHDPKTDLRLTRRFTLFGGEKEINIVVPEVEPVKVSFDLGLSPHAKDEHQLLRARVEWEWKSGQDVWQSGKEVLVGSEGMWELREESRGYATPEDFGRLRRVFPRHSLDREDSIDLLIPASIVRFQPLYCVLGEDGNESEGKTYWRQTSNLRTVRRTSMGQVDAKLAGSLDAEPQEFQLYPAKENRIAVSLPDDFKDAFAEEARIQILASRYPKFDPKLVLALAAKYEEPATINEFEVPHVGSTCRSEGGFLQPFYLDQPYLEVGRELTQTIKINGIDGTTRIIDVSARLYAYFSMPDKIGNALGASTARCLLAFRLGKLEGLHGPDNNLIALASPTAWHTMEPSSTMTGAFEAARYMEVDEESLLRVTVKEYPDDDWLLLDITDAIRSSSLENPLNGLLLKWDDSNELNNVMGFINDPKYKQLRPRLLVVDAGDSLPVQ